MEKICSRLHTPADLLILHFLCWSGCAPQITNKAVGWAALWGLVYTYLPGCLVCFAQVIKRDPTLKLWPWMKRWMDMRKQLGLLALFGKHITHTYCILYTYKYRRDGEPWKKAPKFTAHLSRAVNTYTVLVVGVCTHHYLSLIQVLESDIAGLW